jgi:hypothetical protein
VIPGVAVPEGLAGRSRVFPRMPITAVATGSGALRGSCTGVPLALPLDDQDGIASAGGAHARHAEGAHERVRFPVTSGCIVRNESARR